MNRIKYHYRKPVVSLAFVFSTILLISASTASAMPSQEQVELEPGTYVGTMIFTLEHTYTQTSEMMPLNYFSLLAEDVMGYLKFRVHSDGTVPGIRLRIPPFQYTVASSQDINVPPDSQGTYNCTGNVSYGGGQATISGGSGAPSAPALTIPVGNVRSSRVRYNAGDPWGRVTPTGDCPPSPGPDSFITGIKSDFNGTMSSSFEFYVDWQTLGAMGGTCSNAGWVTADRSITCYWAVYSNGYRRLTAPGP